MGTNEELMAEIEVATKAAKKTLLGTGISDDVIERAQEVLGLRFSPGVRVFLKAHSGGVVRGKELYGINSSPDAPMPGADLVYMTQVLRKHGLDPRWLPIYDDQGDRTYFVDCDVPVGEEGKVYVENLELEPQWRIVAPNYFEFVLDVIRGSIR